MLLRALVPLLAACSCPDQKVIRSPAALVGVTIPIQPSNAECEGFCGAGITKCQRIAVSATTMEPGRYVNTPEYTVLCSVPSYCPGGRRPAGLHDDDGAAHFAELARLEAASVQAFEELAIELALHGAPPQLIEAARRAAREEIDHAQRAGRLAARYGAEAVVPVVDATSPRSLAEILVDNAVEGLVHERYGAALAAVRAVRAGDPAVRETMSVIARDEATHAELAAAIHAWGMPRVTRGARGRIEDARAETTHALVDLLDVEPSAAFAALTGLPSATLAQDMLATLARQPS
jgi:hypothetical protein